MRKLGISEILDLASKQKTTQEKIDVLHKYNSPVLQMILRYTFEPTVVWDLPEGTPPYTPSPYDDGQAMLYQEARRLYLFLRGGNPNLSPLKREQLFIGLLESLDREDAKLIISVKDKKIPYKGINQKLIDAAFPGLISKSN